MIQEFSVKNFLSFGEKQVISFEATSDTKYEEELTVEMNNKVRLLKLIMIFGPNASGKSNILLAIETLWNILFKSNSTKEKSIGYYMPFELLKNEPTEFSIIFYREGIKYSYDVIFDKNQILHEKLEYYPEGRKSLFYEREKDKIRYGSTLKLSKKTVRSLTDNTLSNHTVLSTFGKTNLDDTSIEFELLYNWIKCNIHEIDEYNNIMDIIEEAQENKELKKYLLESLHISDFNIIDFGIVEKAQDYPQEFIDRVKSDPELPEFVKEKLLHPVKKDIEFTHYTNKGNFNLSGHFESTGTIHSIALLRRFYDLIHKDCIWLIDEIGTSFHSDLAKHNILKFIRNSNRSQLIFTSHNQFFLNEDYVRRDMVWIVEKSKETGETELISVDDFDLHKNASIFNYYNTGKIGGKPDLGSPLLYNKNQK